MPAAEAHAPTQTALSPVPPFLALARTAVIVMAVPFASFLCLGFFGIAKGLLGGCVLGLTMGGILYSFINYGLSLFVPPTVSAGRAQQNGQTGGFAVLMMGKSLALGAVLYVLVVLLKLNVLWLVAGFFITQVSMIASVMARLAKTKVTD